MNEILIDENLNITSKATLTITCKDRLTLKTEDGKAYTLEVDIIADLEKVPKEFHNIFINIMTSRYCATVSVADDTKPFNYQKKKKKWYQIF